MKLPDLRRSPWLTTALTMLTIDSSVQCFLLLSGRIAGRAAIVGTLIWFAVMAYAVYKFSVPWATELASGCATAGGLTREVLGRNYAAQAEDRRRGTTNEIWDALVTIIVAQFGVERESITPETDIFTDLGA